MDASYTERNDAARARLRACLDGLGEAELTRPLGEGWTIAAGLAHLAWWDRYARAALETWRRDGAPPRTGEAHEINAVGLSDWLALPPAAAAAGALEAAEAVDRHVAGLPADLVEAVRASGRTRLLDRSLHRNEHLDQIEQVLRGR